MTFGRLIYWVTPENRRGFRQVWVPARFITIIFTSLDMLSFSIQCIGIFFLIAKLSNSNQTPNQQNQSIKTAYDILRVGFIMQNVVFGVFTIVAVRFMFASKAWKFDWPGNGSNKWRTLGWAVVTAALLIFVSLSFTCLKSSFLINHDSHVRYSVASNSRLTEATTTSDPTSGHSISSTWCLSSVCKHFALSFYCLPAISSVLLTILCSCLDGL